MPEYRRVEDVQNLVGRLPVAVAARRAIPPAVAAHDGHRHVAVLCAMRDQTVCIIVAC